MASAIGEIIDKLKEFVEIKTEQIKLVIYARVSKIVASGIVISILIFLGFFLIFFLSLALSNLFNELLESQYLGYFLVSGGYFLAVIIVIILSRKGLIQKWIESALLSNSENEDESNID